MYDVSESDELFARPAGLELLARIYRPIGAPADGLAALVDVHGGSWTTGDRTQGKLRDRALAASGAVVIAVDLRLGPGHHHPSASADAAAGVRWVRAHAGRLGVDPRRVGIIGSSSGGHLALLVAVRPGADEHRGTPIVLPGGALEAQAGDDAVAFALALWPAADPITRFRYARSRLTEPGWENEARRIMTSSLGYFGTEAQMQRASVARIVASGEAAALPPLWLAQPETDDKVPAIITTELARAYERAGGEVEHVMFPGTIHGFGLRPSEATDRCNRLICEFVARRSGPQTPAAPTRAS